MDRLTKLLQKLINKETVTYIVFGVLTTVVNLVVFKLFNVLLGEKLYLITNVIAWVAAVVFAYVTNKLFVFESKSWSASVLKKEIPSFAAARILSLGIEEGGLYVLVNLLHFDRYAVSFGWLTDGSLTSDAKIGGTMLSKLFLAVIVVIFNYILSKLIIFKKKANTDNSAD